MCKEAMSMPNIILHNKIVCYTCYEYATFDIVQFQQFPEWCVFLLEGYGLLELGHHTPHFIHVQYARSWKGVKKGWRVAKEV